MDFSLSFNVVFPLFVYMFVGILARKTGMLDAETCSRMNAFNFRVLFGVNMFRNVFTARDSFSADSFRYLVVCVVYTLFVFVLFYFAVPLFWKKRARASSVIQGCYRGNSMLFALPVVESLCGSENAALASMCVSVVVPLYNILAVVLFETMRGNRVEIRPLIGSILKNPLIIGAIAGGAAALVSAVLGFEIHEAVMKPVSVLSSMNSPLSLILLGAGLNFGSIRKDLKDLAFVSAMKLVAVPAGMAAVCLALGYSGIPFISLFSIFCVPTAVSSYPMAEQMGGDGPFSAEVIAVTSLLSLVTVFIWVVALQAAGMV